MVYRFSQNSPFASEFLACFFGGYRSPSDEHCHWSLVIVNALNPNKSAVNSASDVTIKWMTLWSIQISGIMSCTTSVKHYFSLQDWYWFTWGHLWTPVNNCDENQRKASVSASSTKPPIYLYFPSGKTCGEKYILI